MAVLKIYPEMDSKSETNTDETDVEPLEGSSSEKDLTCAALK